VCGGYLGRQKLRQQAAGPALAQDEGTTELPRRGWTEAERVVHQQWIIECVRRCIGSAPGKNAILADKSPKGRVVISGAIEVEAGRVELATRIRSRIRSVKRDVVVLPNGSHVSDVYAVRPVRPVRPCETCWLDLGTVGQ
jgi:hypothetical protein